VKLKRQSAVGTKADPIMLEVFNNLFMSIAEQMGVSLQNTAYSVNIKERLDFSCAVFAADASLVANAPHMPCISARWIARWKPSSARTRADRAGRRLRHQRALQRRHAHPGPHGLHAVFVYPARKLSLFFTSPLRGRSAAQRSGRGSAQTFAAPPSPPSPARGRERGEQAAEDPVLGRLARPSRRHRRHRAGLDVAGRHLDRGRRHLHRQLQAGRPRQASASGALRLLTKSKYPARNPLQNVNDLKAQIAANEKGVQELHKMVGQFSCRSCRPTWRTCRTTPRKRAPRDRRAARQRVQLRGDQGNVIKVRITVDKKKREATVDFTGTSPQQGTNFNAPEPVTRAAVLYVFRIMVDSDIR
jgi:5-oxoprolinase (ATP-hydrolysing)